MDVASFFFSIERALMLGAFSLRTCKYKRLLVRATRYRGFSEEKKITRSVVSNDVASNFLEGLS